MLKITIDGVDYRSGDLTERGRALLVSLRFLESQMQKLKLEIEIHQTAQKAYVNDLRAEIGKIGLDALQQETAF